MSKRVAQKTVLVAVLKSRSDLRILLRDGWYRIPFVFVPKRPFTHVAFYQPAVFGRRGKRIEYFGRVAAKKFRRRIELLPDEPNHPRAHDEYLVCTFHSVEKLAKSIRNIVPRRVSFGFTTLEALHEAGDILELYGVPATEQIIQRRLKQFGIIAVPEHAVSAGGKRYRIDLVVWCTDGAVAIECDNRKAHSSKIQKQKDRQKDAALKYLGWRVVRLSEEDIVDHLDESLARIQKAISSLGSLIGCSLPK